MPRNSDTRAATAARQTYAARNAAADPERLGRSVRVTAAGIAAGLITADDLASAVALAASAPVPDPETVARLRALLGVTPTRGVVARGARGAVSPR